MSLCSIKGLAKGLVRVSAVFGLLLFFGCGGGGGGDDDDKGKNSNSNSNSNNYPKSSVLGGSGSDGETKSIGGIECVMVKAGTFTMGATDAEEGWEGEYPRHQVTLTKDYWVSKYPVTQKQYRDAMGNNPSSTSYGIGDNYPVNMVSWEEAAAFCKKVGERLLTEAEWEFAARGGKKSNGYIYSGSNTVGDVAWYSGNSGSTSHPVETKSPNELGIHDMSGNVWEWVNDWYGSYPSGAMTDPTGPVTGSHRVIRGGNWSGSAWGCRALPNRDHFSPSIRGYYLGLRVAFDVE